MRLAAIKVAAPRQRNAAIRSVSVVPGHRRPSRKAVRAAARPRLIGRFDRSVEHVGAPIARRSADQAVEAGVAHFHPVDVDHRLAEPGSAQQARRAPGPSMPRVQARRGAALARSAASIAARSARQAVAADDRAEQQAAGRAAGGGATKPRPGHRCSFPGRRSTGTGRAARRHRRRGRTGPDASGDRSAAPHGARQCGSGTPISSAASRSRRRTIGQPVEAVVECAIVAGNRRRPGGARAVAAEAPGMRVEQLRPCRACARPRGRRQAGMMALADAE